MADETQVKSNKLGWAAIIASILVPLAAGYVGGIYATRTKEIENDLKYIEIAVSIIREEPKQETSALREWAVDVIAARSIVPLPKKAQEELKENRVRLGYSFSATDPSTPVDYSQLSNTHFQDGATYTGSLKSGKPAASAPR